MDKRILIPLAIVLIVLALGGYLVFKEKIGTINVPRDAEVKEDENGETPESLAGFTMPEGFYMEIFARNVEGARVIELDPKGRLLVSQTSEGRIMALENNDDDGEADERFALTSGLKKPHGMAMNCGPTENQCFLYVAESDALSRYPYNAEEPSLGAKEKLISISSGAGDRHFTRHIIFLPSPDENTLLISVGSSCDVCYENDQEHGAVLSYNIETKEKKVYATGLRNATFMTLDPVSGRVFASEMGRDGLGDDIPPDEINIIEEGKNYGWPTCYGKNIHDTDFDKKTYIRNPCMEPFETPSYIDLQAHSAPLGLSFIPEEGWPEDMWYDLLVAYHGSWNRSVPTGYKIVRLKMDTEGNYSGTEDFITGWLTADGKKLGRPADIKVLSGGTMYISDDEAGVIYRVSRTSSI